MSKEEIVLKLVLMGKSKRDAIIDTATQAYFDILLAIVNDIYRSCIKDYYSGYVPLVYDRHGNIDGINLYKADASVFDGEYLHVLTDSKRLSPYKYGEADAVLYNVENGKRGGKGIKGWPKRWSTSYPNSYSKYHVWYSSGSTIEAIFSDFQKTVLPSTTDLLWKCVEKCM